MIFHAGVNFIKLTPVELTKCEFWIFTDRKKIVYVRMPFKRSMLKVKYCSAYTREFFTHSLYLFFRCFFKRSQLCDWVRVTFVNFIMTEKIYLKDNVDSLIENLILYLIKIKNKILNNRRISEYHFSRFFLIFRDVESLSQLL